VLVHGLVVSSRYMLPLAEVLARWFDVYAPDLPGFGRSEKPPRAFDVPELADALARWLDTQRIARAALLANSFGCQVVADLAVRYPRLVERAVLTGPTVDPAARTAPRQVGRFLLEAPQQATMAPVIVGDFVGAGPRRTLETFRHLLADPIERKLPHVHAPALVIRGERDRIVSERWAAEAARLLPHGRLAVLRGAGHALNWVAPLALAERATPFLLEAR
jgi:pimeloyl-ACP methyl ester carboxylesterase